MRPSTTTLSIISTTILLLNPILAEELDAKNVPAACTTICAPIISLTSTCDVDNDTDKTESDDAIESTCICTNKSFDVASISALCASCIGQNGATTDDMVEIMSACSFTSMSYAPSATALVASVSVSATKPTATGAAMGTTTGSASMETSTPSSGAVMDWQVGGLGYFATVCVALGFGWGIM
ncbi:hypothetical protein ONS95_002894 [Cadophora gregata]|uniref:uncharacterized protein n=1 Tax=Cadophora gregata TaxID=51156 RepID=UPI0026DB68A8|nr:uncharacterized protein ONS95_002894 [Cadophora gregata]KAK0108073.1 hypothetical protein ONS95_002894 [Cadophora gregata]KAK0109340.1 hypothetical protein ONS96_003159 [Cadophora gregata f. sp. sojae]